MMNQNNALKLIAVITIIIVLSAGLMVVFTGEEKKKDTSEKEEIVIDDRINPLIYQGLTVEILRMRNRGLLDKISTSGTSWRNTPEYFYVIEVDGEIGDSAEVEAAGGVTGSGTFTEWDTMLKECRTNFKVPNEKEGQETSDVTITIMEVQKSGLFGRKTNAVEKLSVDLVFDYRTGHWTGDDHLKDKDGYGHVLGEDYEIWFNLYESDYDHDFIPYWTEVNVYGTDPTIDDGKSDPDGDGIPSWWEWKYGYDPFTWDNHDLLDPDLDGVENTEEYMMENYFADPYYPDVYIEVDSMEKNPNRLFDFEHVICEEAQQMVIEKMSRYGISIYFDDGWPDGPINGGGETLEFVETIDEIVGGHMARWYKHNFADERKGVFRYFVMAYNAGCITASEFNTYDHILMDNSPRKVLINRFAWTPRLQRFVIGKGTLHELGHTMGIVPAAHPGIDNMPQGNIQWPETLTDEEWEKVNVQYKSIMNYEYMFPYGKNFIEDFSFLEFSDGTNGEYDFNDLVHFYLPTFQMDASILESPDIRYGTFDNFEWTDKDPDPVYSGWKYDENLTEDYSDEFEDLRFDIDNAVDYYYRIYVKTDDNTEKGREIRIYTKPEVKPIPALWTLIKEGELKDDGSIEWYSFDDKVCNLLDLIE
jgi:hypothetical protein